MTFYHMLSFIFVLYTPILGEIFFYISSITLSSYKRRLANAFLIANIYKKDVFE